jgi:hypothetical protein
LHQIGQAGFGLGRQLINRFRCLNVS